MPVLTPDRARSQPAPSVLTALRTPRLPVREALAGLVVALALVVAPLVREHGMGYFIATVLLAGVLRMVLAVCGAAKLVRFIPRSVMAGFVNALAILSFTAQLPQLIGVPWMVYPLVAAGLALMILMPRIAKAVPAPLVSIVVVIAAVTDCEQYGTASSSSGRTSTPARSARA